MAARSKPEKPWPKRRGFFVSASRDDTPRLVRGFLFQGLDRMQELQDASRQIIAFIMLGLAGLIGRTLVSPEPLNWRRFAGEMILTAIGAVALYALGMLQGLTLWQMVLLGCGTSLGGLRALEWGVKIARAVKAVRP